MGYYTNYELYVEEDMNQPLLKNIIEKILECNAKDYEFLYPFIMANELDLSDVTNLVLPKLNAQNQVFKFEPYDEAKWYNHEEEIQRLSKEFPETLFYLHGEGEETGDIWDKYFLNGKIQKCYAKIVIPDFDITKLE